jgi:hypothetical protein
LSDSSGRPRPGPHQLVIRAAFVPDGAEPPPEFAGRFDQLRMRATYDPATGQLTCATPGTHFGGDIRAEWYPDQVPRSQAGADPVGQRDGVRQTGTPDGAVPDSGRDQAFGPASMRNAAVSDAPDEDSPYRQPDRLWAPTYRPPGGIWPTRSGGRVLFGLAGNGSGDAFPGGPSSSPAIPDPEATGQNAGAPAAEPSREPTTVAFDRQSRPEAQNGSVQPTETEQHMAQPVGSGFDDDAQTPDPPSGEFARAASKTATDASGNDRRFDTLGTRTGTPDPGSPGVAPVAEPGTPNPGEPVPVVLKGGTVVQNPLTGGPLCSQRGSRWREMHGSARL